MNVHSNRECARIAGLLLAGIALGACSFSGAVGATASDVLRAGTVSLELVAPTTVDVGIRNDDGDAVPELRIEPTSGFLELRATDSSLVVEQFALGLSDVRVPAALAGGTLDLHFTDIVIATEVVVVSHPLDWSAEAPLAVVSTDLRLHWSLVSQQGAPQNLAPQRISSTKLSIGVSNTDGRLSATVDSFVEGQLFDFGALAVHDLAIAMTANELTNALEPSY